MNQGSPVPCLPMPGRLDEKLVNLFAVSDYNGSDGKDTEL